MKALRGSSYSQAAAPIAGTLSFYGQGRSKPHVIALTLPRPCPPSESVTHRLSTHRADCMPRESGASFDILIVRIICQLNDFSIDTGVMANFLMAASRCDRMPVLPN